MLDPETFLTELSVAVDDCCKVYAPRVSHPGPAGHLTTSAVVTLAISGRETRFPSARACHRHASRHLRPLLLRLPGRDRCNRLVRACGETITARRPGVGGGP